MLNGPHIVFAGGGSLGNLYPGLAIAEKIKQNLSAAQVSFVGDGRAVERHMIRGEGHHYVAMPCKPAPNGPLEAVRFVTDNFAGFWASRWMVREQRVSLVVGMGGPASAAMVRAAHGCGIPFVLLEQNAVASRTTRRLAGAAEAVCAAFEELRPHLPVEAPFALTGAPGRPAFERLCRHTKNQQRSGRRNSEGQRRLVVIGGESGARALNEAMPEAISNLTAELDGWQVVHQTGEGQLQETEQRYQGRSAPALVVSYIDELASLLGETDLVVCRSGGAMLAELAMAGAPAVLAPMPSADGLQRANAQVFSDSAGCPVVETTATTGSLAKALEQELRILLSDSAKRAEIGEAMASLARPDAAEKVADILCGILCGGGVRLAA